jgi:hypothetical protein
MPKQNKQNPGTGAKCSLITRFAYPKQTGLETEHRKRASWQKCEPLPWTENNRSVWQSAEVTRNWNDQLATALRNKIFTDDVSPYELDLDPYVSQVLCRNNDSPETRKAKLTKRQLKEFDNHARKCTAFVNAWKGMHLFHSLKRLSWSTSKDHDQFHRSFMAHDVVRSFRCARHSMIH